MMPLPSLADLAAKLARIPPDELARQHRLLTDGAGLRSVLTALVYALAAFFVALPVVLVCAVVDFASERLSLHWMKGLDPARAPRRYVATIAAGMLSQLAYAMVLAFAYQSSLPLAQPFAAGVLTLTMLQMASIRIIHLPYAISGLSVTFAVGIGAVLYDWESRTGVTGLIMSLIALWAAAYFIAAIVRGNHGLHAEIAREGASARMADQAKSRFLAQMSHELRTPLNAILGLGHAELAQATDPASQERLRLMTDAARGLAVILDDILDMSAIEAGHLPIRPTPCSPAQEITTAAALYRPLFEAEGLSVTLNLSPDLPDYAALDSQRLRQCLSNLFSNALKHTKTGGVTLRAAVALNGDLVINFADTGPGIPQAAAERLFEPFHRGAGDQPGTGLGLSITRALARSMGGDLQLMPSLTGAEFRLRLALQVMPRVPSALETDKEPFSATSVLPSELSVLVVDDIATNRLVAKAHLHLHGITVDEAASGAEALARLQEDGIDLVLLDMNMPGIDGTETLQRIRAMPGRTRLPVIAMTADATEEHRRRYLAAGMDGYLAKPLTPESVAEMLARYAPAAR
jgi:signal transduction histidine kinase/ActR/RegA family two-component response regulator